MSHSDWAGRMKAFLMHVGHPGHVDIPYTVTRRRTVKEVLDGISQDAPERPFFGSDRRFLSAFPDRTFNCWGVPPKAEPRFGETSIGDLVLIAPWIGIHNGGIHQIGLVKAKCPEPAFQASRVLWPKTPYERLYPWLLFFDTEVGNREWYDFLDDIGYGERWNPRGWYRLIPEERFQRWGGTEGYLKFLRSDNGFAVLRH
jgi:hypothetical protein